MGRGRGEWGECACAKEIEIITITTAILLVPFELGSEFRIELFKIQFATHA